MVPPLLLPEHRGSKKCTSHVKLKFSRTVLHLTDMTYILLLYHAIGLIAGSHHFLEMQKLCYFFQPKHQIFLHCLAMQVVVGSGCSPKHREVGVLMCDGKD